MTEDDYLPAPSRQTSHLTVTIKGNRGTLSRPAHRWLVASIPEAGARVRWLVRRDGSGFALEATTEARGSYSLKSTTVNVAPAVQDMTRDQYGQVYDLTADGGRLHT